MDATASKQGPILVTFSAGVVGEWVVDRIVPVIGEPLDGNPERLSISVGLAPATEASWSLRGVVSNMRYTTRSEASALGQRRPVLNRPEATRAVLIPIRKSAAWWDMTQDERRAIYEERSRHTSIGLEYLPRIARRLHHSRDLSEPFDFLTWFEFAPQHEPAFIELLGRLRGREEWQYVEREFEVWVRRD